MPAAVVTGRLARRAVVSSFGRMVSSMKKSPLVASCTVCSSPRPLPGCPSSLTGMASIEPLVAMLETGEPLGGPQVDLRHAPGGGILAHIVTGKGEGRNKRDAAQRVGKKLR
jgi:hypothetical protein